MNRNRSAMALAIIAALIASAVAIHAQEPGGLEGKWEGTLTPGDAKLRLVLEISKASDGAYTGTLVSVDQGGARIPINKIQVTGNAVRLEVPAVNGSFDGEMSADRNTIKGTWTQTVSFPLEFTRAAKAAEPAKPSAPSGPPQIDLEVRVSPVPFTAGGKTHLVYDLHITNVGSRELLLSRLEVLSGDSPIASFEGVQLNELLIRPGTPNLPEKRALGPGLRAVACLWITPAGGSVIPRSLRHRIAAGGEPVQGAAVAISDAKPVVLGPPLRGSDWLAGNGPSNTAGHRRALIAVEGRARIAQRFAIDWVRLGPDEATFSGDPKDNKNYHAYGQEVLAVADGLVASTKDGIPENVPGPTSRAVPITLETIGGNYVVLDLGAGRFAFYGHLQPGSLRVKTGDKVRRGQVLALLGNSGNSTEPHLHFHVSDAQSPLGSEGMPYLFESFELLGGSSPGQRKNELPLLNDRVRFPGK